MKDKYTAGIAATAIFTLCVLGTAVVPSYAQLQRGQPLGAAIDQPGVPPAELQRMFDAYALLQAQEQLKIGDEQYPQFLTRFKALQDARRRGLHERTRIIQELRRITNQGQADENMIKDRLKALQDLDARTTAEVRKAYDAVDQVLDVQQQAKFRIFEEVMERRKVELLTRARQANRLKNKP